MKDFRLNQSESNNGSAYDSFVLSPKHRFGFISIQDDFVCHVAFDSLDEYMELLSFPQEDMTELKTLGVGDQVIFNDGSLWIRLW